MNKRNIKNTQWSILICVILLAIIGLIALYTATKNAQLDEFKKQCIWLSVSIIIMIAVMKIDYNLVARFSVFFYGIFMLLLVIVLFTPAVNGATSWFNIGFFAFQPGELAKIFVIMFLSYTIVEFQKKYNDAINRPVNLLMILAIGFLPILLIAMQPDYGTAIAYIVALTLMLYVARNK